MTLWDKIKDLFEDDPEELAGPDKVTATEPKQQAMLQKAPRLMENKAASKPKKGADQTASNNYIERKNDAIRLVCSALSRYAESRDKHLAVLQLWIIRAEDKAEVQWGDEGFVEELFAALRQERVTAIKRIEIKSVTYSEFLKIKEANPDISAIDYSRLYYLTHPYTAAKPAAAGKTDALKAQLQCVKGQEFMANPSILLDPSKQTVWSIGRGMTTANFAKNDIVIDDECRNVSSNQALLSIRDNTYYLQCKVGGCRMQHGTTTKICHPDGTETELMTVHNLYRLNPGDIICLAKTIYLQFTYL